MSYTLRSNHHITGFIEQANNLVNSFQLNQNRNYLFLSLFGTIQDYLPALLKHIDQKYDFVIVLFPYESPDWYKCIRPLFEVCKHFELSNFAVIDCGKPITHCRHFLHNPFVNENHDSWSPVPLAQRTDYFVCANRVMKSHRIKLLNEIYSIPTDKKIITAGNFNLEQYFTIQTNFPYPLSAPDEKAVLDSHFDAQRFMPMSFKSCVFNLVTESSYENIGDSFETWSRIMITEKTIRPFRLHQLPIFLAPAGHVTYLKQLGFDVFDDLIDHSYDLCDDPNKRIIMVSNLVKSVTVNSLKFWQDLCVRNYERFEYNQKHCDVVKKQLDFDLVNSFNAWANAQ